MKEFGVITDIEQVTPERLTSIFKNKGYLSNGKVTKTIKKNSEISVTSNMHYMELNFSNDAQTVPTIPNIVVRFPKHYEYNKMIGRHEAKFYDIVAENMNQLPIPICYDVAYSEETGWSHIMLEDLSKKHVEIEPSQGGGCAPPPTKQYCEKAIDSLAELHAYWWDHPKLMELSKYSYTFYDFKENSYNDQDLAMISVAPPDQYSEGFTRFENVNDNLVFDQFRKLLENRISDKRKSYLQRLFSSFPLIAHERIKTKNITIIHNDAHMGNFFYPKDMLNQKSKAKLIDWQTWGIGVGCQDIAYMIGMWFFPDYRHLIEKDLIKRYHDNLLKFGINNYSWDDCWRDYKLFALLNLYRIIFWWCFKPPLALLWMRLECSLKTIEDLNCMELLEY